MRRSPAAPGLVLVLVACSIGGCEGPSPPTESASVPLAEVTLATTVTSDGSVAVVEARLATTGAVPLVISPSEGLAVDAQGAPTTALEARDYRAFATVRTTGAKLFVRHVRPDGARTTEIDLPPPFVVVAEERSSRRAPLALSWEPNEAEPVTIEARSSCSTQPLTRRLERDRGEYAFAPGDFGGDGSCTIVVRVSRSRSSRGPNASTTATQLRTVTVETTP